MKIRIGEERLISAAEGNGPVNALDLALRKDLGVYQKYIEDLELLDYRVRVFQGGTDAVTRVLIEFGDGDGDALVDGRRLGQHHRRLVPGAGRRDHLSADQGRRRGAIGRAAARRAASHGVPQDRGEIAAAGNVGVARRHDPCSRQQRPARDLVRHAIVDTVGAGGEGDSAVVVRDGSRNLRVHVDDQRVDGAEGRGARGLGDILGRAALLLPRGVEAARLWPISSA